MSEAKQSRRSQFQTLHAFQYPSYRLFWTAMAASAGAQHLWRNVQNWLVLELSDSPFALGIVGFCNQFPVLVLTVFAGAIADRTDKRRLLMCTELGFGVSLFLLTGLAAMGLITWQIIAVFALLCGIINAFWYPARQAIVPDIVERNDVMNAIALNSAGFYVALVLSSLSMGWLMTKTGAGGSFGIGGGFFMVSAALLLRMRFTPKPIVTRQDNIWQGVATAFSYVGYHPVVLILLILTAVNYMFGVQAVNTLMAVFARDLLKVGVTGMGSLLAAQSWGSLLGAMTLASLSGFRQKGKLLLGALLCYGLLIIAFAVSPNYALSLGLIIGCGIASAIFTSTLVTALQLSVPNELRGRVMALFFLISMGLASLGSLQAGWVADLLGASSAIIIGGIINCISALIIFAGFADVRRLS